MWAENQKGELALRGTVTLKIFYSLEDENRFRMGQPPLIVNVPSQSIRVAPPPPPPAVKAASKQGKPAKPAKKTAPKPAARKSAPKAKPRKKKK